MIKHTKDKVKSSHRQEHDYSSNTEFVFDCAIKTMRGKEKMPRHNCVTLTVVAFVEDNATMGSMLYFENYVSDLVQNRRK